MKVAVIVNDMSEVNIDEKLITRVEEKVVALSNGCICCTLREDLLKTVAQIADSHSFDYLVIESSGISEPLPIAETFTFDDESGVFLKQKAKLDTLVTLVDAKHFLEQYNSKDSLQEVQMAASSTDTRRVVDLLIEQVEFANVIVINKADLISEVELRTLKSLLSSLNPSAHILSTTFGTVPLKAILNTGLFDFNRASQAPGWLQELRGTHKPETLEFGISSFVFEANKPFHPAKLCDALKSGRLANVVRSKGFVWLANSSKHQWIWSHAGSVFRFEKGGPWHHHHDHGHKHNEHCEQVDKKQCLVLIGVTMDHALVRKELQQCLCEGEFTGTSSEPFSSSDKLAVTVGAEPIIF
eukprot:TRINITY_DN1251_c0_g1_i2.p1 TRINITY_DN1251_c0_g1~~TRINITY_DN1251_c0_g1_i2.p1  ORF type:complete len:355 (+),score=42.61 TRINITY_DN1251_c0_g1_i2:748-1812(+)